MHEIGIAKGILKKVLEVAGTNKGKRVTKIRVKAGFTEMLKQDELQYAFTMLAKDTIVSKAKIELNEFAGSGISIEEVEMEG